MSSICFLAILASISDHAPQSEVRSTGGIILIYSFCFTIASFSPFFRSSFFLVLEGINTCHGTLDEHRVVFAQHFDTSCIHMNQSRPPITQTYYLLHLSHITISSKLFLGTGRGIVNAYPRGKSATTRTSSGILNISLTFFSSNAPIQQVPSPSSTA